MSLEGQEHLVKAWELAVMGLVLPQAMDPQLAPVLQIGSDLVLVPKQRERIVRHFLALGAA